MIGSFRPLQARLLLPSLARQAILLLAATGFVRDGHLDETFGNSRTQVFLGRMRAIVQSRTLKDLHSCTFTIQATDEVSDLQHYLRGT